MVLLENLRFHPGEEKNDPAFADQLAALGDALRRRCAFAAAHRAHASITGLAERLPAAAGRLMQAEIEALTRALDAPERPLAALVGGAKVSTKLEVLGNLIERVDLLVLGGGMANTFLFAQGTPVGKSLCEKDMADTARAIMAKAESGGCQLLLPIDGRVARRFEAGAPSEVVPIERVPEDAMILDVGPGTAQLIEGQLAECRTVVWNGPLGAFEIPPFDAGHDRGGAAGRGADQGRQADERRGRRRHAGRAGGCRRARADVLRLHRRRRLSRMAGRQGAAGRRRAARGVGSAQVVVHHLEQARAALAAAAELGCAIELRSAPGAAGYAGVGYLKALGDEVGHELLVDCGDDAGLVMAALRTGCRRIAFSGSDELGRRLATWPSSWAPCWSWRRRRPRRLMLQPEDDAAAVLRAHLHAASDLQPSRADLPLAAARHRPALP